MANANVIFKEYEQTIAKQVIDTFGGSYQTYKTLGKTWRQKMDYNPSVEDFVILKTRVFLRTLEQRDKSNINMMYSVCYKISDYLSKYLAKKSPDLTRKMAKENMMDKIFFNFNLFVNKFKQTYKKPIDTTKPNYVASNPGVIAMYKAIQSQR
ncbi:MAG: hypothetical protein IKO56_04795 [Alphaproteobacteria bacterium]|nr:hypothetical protein [Alphaproteobacteria bacterium]